MGKVSANNPKIKIEVYLFISKKGITFAETKPKLKF